MSNPFQERFTSIENKLERVLSELPAMVGAKVVQFSNQAFRNQGFTDESLETWTPRKSETAKSEGRAILVQTGRLRRSIRVITSTLDSVTIGTDVPYAQIHNQGGSTTHYAHGRILNFDMAGENGGRWRFGKAGTIKQQRGIKAIRRATFKEHTTKIPQRKFLGNSHQQTEEIKFLIEKQINKAFSIH